MEERREMVGNGWRRERISESEEMEGGVRSTHKLGCVQRLPT